MCWDADPSSTLSATSTAQGVRFRFESMSTPPTQHEPDTDEHPVLQVVRRQQRALQEIHAADLQAQQQRLAHLKEQEAEVRAQQRNLKATVARLVQERRAVEDSLRRGHERFEALNTAFGMGEWEATVRLAAMGAIGVPGAPDGVLPITTGRLSYERRRQASGTEVAVQRLDDRDDPRRIRREMLAQLVEATAPQRTQDLVHRAMSCCGISEAAARVVVGKLATAGSIRRVQRGLYRLPRPDEIGTGPGRPEM